MKLFKNFPLQTLKVVNSFGSRAFIFFFASLIYFDRHGISITCFLPGDIQRADEHINFTFSELHKVIGKNIRNSLEGSDLNSSKEVILEVLSILKRVSCSSSVEIYSYYNWNSFTNGTMSTKVFIYSYAHFIENLEDDSAIGFDKAYYKLKHLTRYHKGFIPSQEDSKSRIFSLILLCAYYAEVIKSKIFAPLAPKTTDLGAIPSQEDSKSRIFSLILLCAYYAKAIKSKIFAPLDPKTTDLGAIPSQEDLKSTISSLLHLCAYYVRVIKSKIFAPLEPKTTGSASLEPETTDYSPLDPKTTDPGALSFFLKLIHFSSFESLFSSCGSVDKEFVRDFFKREDFKNLLDEYRFESHQHRYSLLPEILRKLDAKGQWGLKVYLKLVYGISI